MRKFSVLLGCSAVILPVSASAQIASSSRDGTTNVQSQNIGAPGQSANIVDQYMQRRGLQDLTDAERTAVSKLGPSRAARKDELTAGAAINDKTGTPMATVAEVDPDGVVVAMGTAKVKVPAEAFGHNRAGLLLDMTKAQFQQVVAQAK